MPLDRETRGDVNVLTPKKNLQGGDETRELQRTFDEIIEAGPPKIVVDLGKISYMTSAGLGVLVGAHTRCVRRGGWLRIARVGTRIKDLFLVTKLTLVFDTYDSIEDAVAAAHQEGS